MMKNYLLSLLHQCSVEQFGQDAIEWAIVSGMVRLTYDSNRDVHEIMSKYDEIIEAFRLSPAQATYVRISPRAPMQRAAPARRSTGDEANSPIQKKGVA